MIFEFRAFSTDSGINISHTIAFSSDKFDCTRKKYLAINILEFSCRIRKMITNISHMRSSQQCIADSMNEHIGIRMT